MQKTGKTARVQARKVRERRKKILLGCAFLAVAAAVVLVVVFGPAVFAPSGVSEESAENKVWAGRKRAELQVFEKASFPLLPQSIDPKRHFEHAGGHMVLMRRDEEGGSGIPEKVTIAELIERRNKALIEVKMDYVRWVDNRILQEGDRMAQDLYIVLLTGENRQVREAAAGLLGRLGTASALSSLYNFLAEHVTDDTDGRILVNVAASCIARMRLETAESALLYLLKENKNEAVRLAAVSALGMRGELSGHALERLKKLAVSGEPEKLRERAVYSLGKTGKEREMDFLCGIATDSKYPAALREAAISAVSGNETEGRIERLSGILAKLNEERLVGAVTGRMVGLARKPDAVASVTAVLRDYVLGQGAPELKKIALDGICMIPGAELTELLSEIAGKSSDEEVAGIARQRLEKIKASVDGSRAGSGPETEDKNETGEEPDGETESPEGTSN